MYNPGSALGAASRMAAGTAIYEALAARMANIKRLAGSRVINWLKKAVKQPFTAGINKA